jgi:hypothetical protein
VRLVTKTDRQVKTGIFYSATTPADGRGRPSGAIQEIIHLEMITGPALDAQSEWFSREVFEDRPA